MVTLDVKPLEMPAIHNALFEQWEGGNFAADTEDLIQDFSDDNPAEPTEQGGPDGPRA
ncbi:MAG: hypothetical protein ACYTEQ_27400 [Planctomycetota bacterium]|jgi:hypothetical protein